MAIDPSKFNLSNVVDTCAVWHIISSNSLYHRAKGARCEFCITSFVHYECLIKPRGAKTEKDEQLMDRLRDAQKKRQFIPYALDIEDLQEVEILRKRRNLGKGELTSIAFAKKTNIAFVTDDQKARRLAASILEPKNVQTTPHLLSWLAFNGHVMDSDKDEIIEQHAFFGQKLAPYFTAAFLEAMRCRSLIPRSDP